MRLPKQLLAKLAKQVKALKGQPMKLSEEKLLIQKHFLENPDAKLNKAAKKAASSFKEVKRENGLVFYEGSNGERVNAPEGMPVEEMVKNLSVTGDLPAGDKKIMKNLKKRGLK